MHFYTCPECKKESQSEDGWHTGRDGWYCPRCEELIPVTEWLRRTRKLIKRGQTLKRRMLIRRDAPRRGKPLMFGPNALLHDTSPPNRANSFAFKGS